MDFFAHGLWAGAIFNRSRHIWRAVFFGIMPDLFSFGILTFIFFFTNGFNRPDFSKTEPPDPSLVPQYVHGLYNITHSLVVFFLVFILVSWLSKRFFWSMTAWALHILIDIPTHSYNFFPTPFLWPISSYKVDGISWGTPWFMVVNYSAIVITYVIIYYRMSTKRKEKMFSQASGRSIKIKKP